MIFDSVVFLPFGVLSTVALGLFLCVRQCLYRMHSTRHADLPSSTQFVIFRISTIVYNVFFHPLAKFPGPKLRAATHLPAWWTMWTGDVHCMSGMHDRYGAVVRIAPDSLSFISAQAWKGSFWHSSTIAHPAADTNIDIYGHNPGRSQIPKDVAFYSRGISNSTHALSHHTTH